MPRIRKKTTKRGTTARREKIKHKVKESRKKAKKAAKKDVTWKSKKSKDPGIPNNFPYKDQILAEIAEERRQSAEAKTRRKEEKKVLRAQQKAGLGENGEQDSDGENVDVDAKGGVATSKPKKSAAASTTKEDATVVPPLMNAELPHLSAVLNKADVVIEILDARDPLAHRSKALETQVSLKEGQKLLLVLNKIDGCPREPTVAWAAYLRAEHPTLLFRAASSFLPPVVGQQGATKGKGKEKEPSDDAWGVDAVYTLLGRWAHEKTCDGPLHVAVVGLTNSGKSAFVNSLARKTALDVYAPSSSTSSPSTTPYALEVTLEIDGKPVVFIDTPGLAWHFSEDASPEEEKVRHRAQDILLRNKGRIDHLKDPIPAVSYIVSRAETEDLMVHYCLPAFAKGDADAFLMAIARANVLIKKGGDPDLVGAARLVLRDWSTGKLPHYAVPPPIARQAADGDRALAANDDDGDAALLERLLPRKELRRSCDVVRLSSGRVDERALGFETPWFGSGAESDAEMQVASEEEDEEEEVNSDGDESTESDAQQAPFVPAGNEDDDGDDGNASDDEEAEHVNTNEDGNEDEGTTTSARKRKLPHGDPARPNNNKKKVTFAVQTVPPSPKGRAPDKKKQKRKVTTPDLVRAPASAPSTNNKKAKIGLESSSSSSTSARAQGAAARRTGSMKPAANTPTAAQKRKNQTTTTAEDGAYDFSKFF